MTEPRRWLSDARGGLESALLRAGAEEAPSQKAVERTVLAVGAGAATLGVVGVAASAPMVAGAATATGLGAVGAVKLLAIGAVAGLASGGTLWGVSTVVRRAEKPTPAAPAVVSAAPARAPVAPPPPAVEATAPPAEPVATEPAPTPVAPSSARDEGAPLAAEVALVDRAHAALRSGDARTALDALERYEGTFAKPRLLPEVLALRMEAAERLGDGGAARLWASRIVSRYPRSAQAARARTLLEGPPEEDQ